MNLSEIILIEYLSSRNLILPRRISTMVHRARQARVLFGLQFCQIFNSSPAQADHILGVENVRDYGSVRQHHFLFQEAGLHIPVLYFLCEDHTP